MPPQAQLFMALKRVLRVKKIAYKQVAARLRVSEATVKRTFSTEDCSFSRFLEICEVAGVTLPALAHAAEQIETSFELDDEVAARLAADIDLFIFFVKLFEYRTVAALLAKEPLDQRSLARYLRELEELRLIERLPGDEVRLVSKLPYSSRHPQLVLAFLSRWAPALVAKVIAHHGDGRHFLKANGLRLTPGSVQAFLKELDDLRRKYDDREILEADIGSELEDLGVVVGIGPYRFGDGLVIAKRAY